MTKSITLAITGSISAYKAADLTNQLIKLGYDIHVLMTESATKFITPLTLQVLSKKPVYLDVMKEETPNIINHIDIGKQTDLFLVAPASANTIAHLAHGFADNMVTATALALPLSVSKLIAPAMNTKMYNNPLTQRNLTTLKEIGYQVIEPRTSQLACGDIGRGALAELDVIIEAVQRII